ncbi:MAG TPA: hypothetical protein VK734_18885 [Bradyrhizobium sp.]|jgi:hypothetical protein|nr:hypothetical protein [Bradyrhizobium sp.]
MSSMGRKSGPPTQGQEKTPQKSQDKSKKPPPRAEDDDEDGDIATPKRDRYGNDDEPL